MNTQTNNEAIQRTMTIPVEKKSIGKSTGSQRSILPVKLTLDVVILLFLALEYQKRAISMQFHEIGGLALGCLFLVHQLLNFRWIRSVTKGILSRRTKINMLWVVDALLTLFMAAVIVTGLLISKTLPTAIQNGNGIKVWHYFCAASAIICTGVHLGLHWTVIKRATWNKVPLHGTAKKAVGILLICVITIYGCYSFVAGSTLRWLSQPFANQSAMGFPGQMPAMQSLSGSENDAETPETADMTTAENEIPADGETRNESIPETAQSKNKQGFSHDGKMQTGSFSSACTTVLSYGSVILLFAALTAFIHSELNALKKRSILKKQTVIV